MGWIELHAIVKGKVQGVGFRWTVVELANKHGLKGQVKNLSTGGVEIIAQGAKEQLDAFLNEVKSDPGHASIESIDSRFYDVATSYHEFKIIH